MGAGASSVKEKDKAAGGTNVVTVMPKAAADLHTSTQSAPVSDGDLTAAGSSKVSPSTESFDSSNGVAKLAWPQEPLSPTKLSPTRSSSPSMGAAMRSAVTMTSVRPVSDHSSAVKSVGSRASPEANTAPQSSRPGSEHQSAKPVAGQGVARTNAVNVGNGSASNNTQGDFRPGQKVRIGGLTNSTDLNGQEGILRSWDKELGRWVVRLHSGQDKGVRAVNLTVVAGGGGSGRGQGHAIHSDTVNDANKELEGLLLQTNWSAIYQLFYQRFGIATLETLERGYVVKSAVEMSLSIVAKCFALLRSDPSGRLHCTPLHIAALQSSVEAAEVIVRDLPKLVEQTHRASHTALCPLHIAILCGAQGIVELLLEGKANPNVRTLHDVCPLHLAATTSKELCQLLMSYNADPLHRDVMGSTALHYAVSFKQEKVVEFLLSNTQVAQRLACEGDQKRVTPLHISCALLAGEPDLPSAMALLANGAKPWVADVSGASSRDVVPRAAGKDLMQFFEKHGDRAQNAAQQWLDERYLSQSAAQENDDDNEGWNALQPPSSGRPDKTREGQAALEAAKPRIAAPATSGVVPKRGDEARFQTEVERLTKEVAESKAAIAEMDSLKQELQRSKEKCQMLEQSMASQQGSSQALQEMVDNARRQQQVQLEELQKRHADERESWEARLKAQLDAARAEVQAEANKQLESLQREMQQQKDEWEARLRSLDGNVVAAEARASAAESRADAAVEAESTAKAMLREASAAAGKTDQAEVQRMSQLYEEANALAQRRQNDISEVLVALKMLSAKLGLRPTTGKAGDDGNASAAIAAVGSVEAEIERIRGETASEVDRVRGDLDRMRADLDARDGDLRAAREEVKNLSNEGVATRKALHEAEDRCAKYVLAKQEAEDRGTSQAIQWQTRLKELELQNKQVAARTKADIEAAQKRAADLEAEKVSLQASFQPTIDRISSQLRDLQQRYAEEQMLRKKYHNQIQDMKGAIRVFCRFRPFVKREIDQGDTIALRKFDAFTVELERPTGKGVESKAFQFDSIFEGASTQEEVFADCRDLIQSAVDGYNVTIFAYGQTGAGKTHTMYGSMEDPGLAPRSIQSLFDVIRREEQAGTKQFRVKAYMIEVYKQDIIDLLASKPPDGKKSLEVKRDVGRGIMFVDGVTERQVCNPQELSALLVEGEKKRHVTATKMNSTSSRSHLLLSIIVECTVKDPEQIIYGKITLCDLAGSERPKKSEVSGDALKEAIEINKSLSALGDVIEALTKGAKSVPYRNHKLTMLMQDSLGGSAKTLMFVNCSPAASNAEETSMSLKWASRARQVTNDVKRNADSKEVARLKQVIAMMSQAQNVQEEAADKENSNAAAVRAGLGLAS